MAEHHVKISHRQKYGNFIMFSIMQRAEFLCSIGICRTAGEGGDRVYQAVTSGESSQVH